MLDETVTCSRCAAACLECGYDREGKSICYACCAEDDRASMIANGRITLYLTQYDNGGWKVSNWPGSLVFRCHGIARGRHNIAGSRRDAWFSGPDGYVWHGIQLGDFSEIVRCKRTRTKVTSSEPVVNAALDVIRREFTV